jgi:outer membrane protein OmpA-like peptidoglycan-associated protein
MTNRISTGIKKSFLLLVAKLLVVSTGCAQSAESFLSSYPEYDSLNDSLMLAQYLSTSYCPHEISFWATGGIATPDTGMGGAFGLGYTGFFNRHWGLSSGIEYAFYSKNIRLNGWNGSYETCDVEGNPIIYQAIVNSYRERQQAGMMNIPLSLSYQTGNECKFHASLGFKFGFPVYGQYKGSDAILTTSGYYTGYDQWEIWQNDLGYGTFPVKASQKKLDLGLSFMGTLETGMKWNVGIGKDLYAGIYMDYGFNNLMKGNSANSRFVEYNSIEPANPLINSASTHFSPLSVGLKLKLGFSVGCNDRLADQRAYKARRSSGGENGDDYFEYIPPVKESGIQNETVPLKPDTTETVKEEPELSALEAERAAYLEAAKERRSNYSQSPEIKSMDSYDLGHVMLTREQESTLDQYVEVLMEYLHANMEITGHTCDLGSEEVNMRIGQERADLAKDYLVEKGVSPARISTFSKGKTEPAFPNNNEENRKKNRRLGLKVIQ